MSPGGGLVGSEHKQHAIRTSTSEPETGKGLGDLEGSQGWLLVSFHGMQLMTGSMSSHLCRWPGVRVESPWVLQLRVEWNAASHWPVHHRCLLRLFFLIRCYVWSGLVWSLVVMRLQRQVQCTLRVADLAHASRDLLQVFRRSRDEQIAHIGWDRYGVLKGCSIHTGMSPSPVATDMPSERDLLRVTEV